MTHQKRGGTPTSVLRQQRNDALFMVYYALGPDRSLERLHDELARMGLGRSLNTVKRYSAQFGWQARVLDMDAKLRAEREQKALAERDEQDERQARLGRNMQVLASAGIKTMHDFMQQGGAPMQATDVAALAKAGVQIERLATGKETDRVRIIRERDNAWTLQISAIFLSVNDLPDPDARKAEFASRFDAFVATQVQQLKGGE